MGSYEKSVQPITLVPLQASHLYERTHGCAACRGLKKVVRAQSLSRPNVVHHKGDELNFPEL